MILLCRQLGLFLAIPYTLASFSQKICRDLEWSPYLTPDRERRGRCQIILVTVAF